MLKSVSFMEKQSKSDSSKPSMLLQPTTPKIKERQLVDKKEIIKQEWLCPQEPNINIYCGECEDLKDFEVVECIENGDVVHRYKCLSCGVILREEDR